MLNNGEFVFADKSAPFFSTVTLECDISAPLGWSLTATDRLLLDASIVRREKEFSEIVGSITLLGLPTMYQLSCLLEVTRDCMPVGESIAAHRDKLRSIDALHSFRKIQCMSAAVAFAFVSHLTSVKTQPAPTSRALEIINRFILRILPFVS
jgi:hypothetical protein